MFGEVSTFSFNKFLLYLRMNTIWTLAASNKKLVIADPNYALLKYIQLAVSKSYILTLQPGNPLDRLPAETEDLQEKLSFVKLVLETEDREIEAMRLRREAHEALEALRITKEFYSLVAPDDQFITKAIDIELLALNQYKELCQAHKGYIVTQLYNLDYTVDFSTLKEEFINSIKNPPSDENYIYEIVHGNLVKAIKS